MSGISITVDATDLDGILKKLRPLFDFDGSELMSAIGALGESHTRRRLTDEKAAPDGTPWPENTEGTSVLTKTGEHLLGSIAWTASADEAEWGASWEYAHVHQDGMTIVPKNGELLVFTIGGQTVKAKKVEIPARPFIGISSSNAEEMMDVITDAFGFLQ
ncbi:phage virion morphogenesis protein [Rhizobium azibense]|uniref:Phage gpG-like protein n=1 Tax=Rhizobium azibense TaxID=1136135 RepID=A0A4R3RIG7_9HYPH|nr:phage virion morphogenesis protein [Rhizobium azibense]TCU35450.1 phage gpG-like protein [Rhizobium azibense]